jgi:hypothetical protein
MRSSVRCAAAAAAALAVVAVPAPSTASAAAFCSFDSVVTVSPGLSMTPTAITTTTSGPTGKITCSGDVYGKAITGPGTIGADATSDGHATCASGSGSGEAQLALPTADGPVELRYPYTFSYVAGLSSFSSSVFSGGVMALPTKGDCFTEPVTELHEYGFGRLTA